jgi:hypothetical protein
MTASRLALAGALVAGLVSAGAVHGQRQGSAVVYRGGHSTQPVSPSSLATVMTSRDVQDERTLDLLVLWRGTPGWFFVTHQSESGGGRAGLSSVSLRYGAVSLDLEKEGRVVRIQGAPVELGDANVILADRVDTDGPVIVEVLRVDPSFPGTDPRVYPILRRSEQIVSFIRCDEKLPDPKKQAVFDHICAQIVGGQ